jgi:ubiquinol-cytochrome c reductase cytochrome c1 subunit
MITREFTMASFFRPAGIARGAVAASLIASALAFGTQPAAAAEGEVVPPAQSWSFDGIFGTFDRGALQRGYKVYTESCASCHAMKFLAYRNLGEPGGPEFGEAEVKAIAAEATVQDGPNEDGDMFERPGLPSDRFVSPFPNDNAARAANNGSLPPDLSVIAKARAHGPDYLFALLTGYGEPPAGFELREGMNYNAAFPGHQIAMPQPLSDEAVEYTDGTPNDVRQLSRDVTTFLVWAAEPKLEARKRAGFQVMIYLVLLAGLLYFTTKKLWTGVEH